MGGVSLSLTDFATLTVILGHQWFGSRLQWETLLQQIKQGKLEIKKQEIRILSKGISSRFSRRFEEKIPNI